MTQAPAAPVPADDADWDLTLPWFERLRRADLPGELWAGAVLLFSFLGVALFEVAERSTSLASLPQDPAWAGGSPIGPTHAHPLGVMSGLGVDVAAALLQATPWDLGLLAGILLIASGIGLFVGSFAGLREGGGMDLFLTFWMDSVAGIPPVVLVTVVFFTLAPHLPRSEFLPGFVVLFGLVLWPSYARPVRARARVVARSDYLEAARAGGASTGRLLLRHLVPNSMGPALAQAPIDVGTIFFVLSAFPFVACYGGDHPLFPLLSPLPTLPFPEWGYLLAQGACNGTSVIWTFNYWWMYTFPAAAIVLFGLAVAMASDGMQKLLARHAGS
jgi:peptide/nickel transport system permease protein